MGPRVPHRRRALHPRSPHRQRRGDRRRVDPRKRHPLRRSPHRRRCQSLRTPSPPNGPSSATARSSNAASSARAAGWTKGFTAAESLFSPNSHCENGEAASIFAGPYTVSHHKSSLLIAGMFSFFNAGSGSNQSNHLFKSGAVHQAVHLRGCKFASSAYIMSPALEGAFTMVMGTTTPTTTTPRRSPTRT